MEEGSEKEEEEEIMWDTNEVVHLGDEIGKIGMGRTMLTNVQTIWLNHILMHAIGQKFATKKLKN